MAAKPSDRPHRASGLTTLELYQLDQACAVIRRAFGHPPYLVGSAGVGATGDHRDVDVRLMLDDAEFAAACPARERWEFLCVAVSAWLRAATGLPVDFQVQCTDDANAQFGGKPRNPLGMGRVFAGGGDATPWD